LKIEFESDQEKEIIYNLSGVKVNRNIKERDKMKQFIVKCQVKDLLEKIKEAWNKEESK